MNGSSETANLDQAEEGILTSTASDEALEAAAGTEKAAITAFSCREGHTGNCAF
jgi:hypothetical protein